MWNLHERIAFLWYRSVLNGFWDKSKEDLLVSLYESEKKSLKADGKALTGSSYDQITDGANHMVVLQAMLPLHSIQQIIIILICTSRFSDMEAIAILLSAIKDHGHRNFVVSILDHIFEQLIRGIEENDFKNA